MNDKDLPAGAGGEFETEPDTGTDETNDDLSTEPEIAPAIPVADSVSATRDAEPEPALAAAGPRVFSEHFWLLMGLGFVMAATASVWARPSIHGGIGLNGAQSIKITLLRGLAFYGLAVGIANIATGRLKAMGSTFVTGVLALWFGIKQMMQTWDQPACRGWSEMEKFLKDGTGYNTKIHVTEYLGQWGPGPWMSVLGGMLIVLVFLKAILFAKKQESAPAPSRRRRR